MGGFGLSGKRYVLPIAINKYDEDEMGYQPLANPIGDTDAIAGVLKKKFGFEIMAKLHNDEADQRTILRTIKDIELKGDDTLVIPVQWPWGHY